MHKTYPASVLSNQVSRMQQALCTTKFLMWRFCLISCLITSLGIPSYPPNVHPTPKGFYISHWQQKIWEHILLPTMLNEMGRRQKKRQKGDVQAILGPEGSACNKTITAHWSPPPSASALRTSCHTSREGAILSLKCLHTYMCALSCKSAIGLWEKMANIILK